MLFEHLEPSLAAPNDHPAWNRGEGSFPPKSLLVSTILTKLVSACSLRLEISLRKPRIEIEETTNMMLIVG